MKSGAVLEGLEGFLRTTFPDLANTSDFSIKVMLALTEAGSLIGLIVFIEKLLLLQNTRSIRGEWVYKSSSGNWGHVRIYLEGTDLRYSVDLYLSKSDLIRALAEHIPMPTIGHGIDRLTVYSNETLYIWYHVPATRYGIIEYPERHGLLTLTRTNDKNNYSARWERTGSIASSFSTGDKQIGGTAEIARLDQGSAAGSFFFFLRKAAFLRHKDTIAE
jgi:hypothetical protein